MYMFLFFANICLFFQRSDLDPRLRFRRDGELGPDHVPRDEHPV